MTLRFAPPGATTVLHEVGTTLTQRMVDGENGNRELRSSAVLIALSSKVLDAGADGMVSLEIEVLGIAGSLKVHELGSFEFDSRRPAVDTLVAPEGVPSFHGLDEWVRQLVGKKFAVKVDRTGEIVGPLSPPQPLPPPPRRDVTSLLLLQMVDADACRDVVAATLLRCPENPVATNSQWTARAPTIGTAFCVDATATVTTLNADVVGLSFRGPLQKRPGEGPATADGPHQQFERNAAIGQGCKARGDATFSRRDCFAETSELTLELELQLANKTTISNDFTRTVKRTTPQAWSKRPQ